MVQQETEADVRIYLGIDGPINSQIEEYLAQNRKKLFKVIHNDQPNGVSVILNKLIDALEDEQFIFRHDADDVALAGRVHAQMDFLKIHLEVDVCGGSIIESDFKEGGYRQVINYPLSHIEIAVSWYKRNAIAHPACCIRSNVFEDGNRYPEEITFNQDLAMWLDLMQKGYIFANLDEPLIEFRVSSQFYKRRGYTMALAEFKLYIIAIKNLNYPLFSRLWPLARIIFRLSPLWLKKAGYRSKLRSRM